MLKNNDDIFGDGVKPKNISYEQWQLQKEFKVDNRSLEAKNRFKRPPYYMTVGKKVKNE
mgnify:CR=1 FL=1